ncbi:hypothetical protein HYH02_010382 [Chlamydomonas schloesseri]|uniref:Fe2OG dioxygenase domain-containing protein n=1 Tax=Chlamydomonas schloesseri TaxID=2026947 RepID=A0A835W7V6_9CHLO|nr:hypothetical protein HYH02_010382 [Chlamydomonas schloesseri]|eukprot:KAG2440504.1 hypothetical protein HYH02_010382 [Chlamydomonas schloesseri]
MAATSVAQKPVDLPAWRRVLANAVASVQAEGNFAIAESWERPSGSEFLALPGLVVKGVGPVSLPISPAQRDELLRAGQQAPYGKGAQTLRDPAVRDTIQIDASNLSFGPGWGRVVGELATRAAEGLGVSPVFVPTTGAQPGHGPVCAHLYKLLLYPAGGHFLPHVDSEKLPGHFATLLVALPVAGGHDGGVLHVRHAGRTWSWDTSRRGLNFTHAGSRAADGAPSGGGSGGASAASLGAGGGAGAGAGGSWIQQPEDEPDGELDLILGLGVDGREAEEAVAGAAERRVLDGLRFAAFFTDCVHEVTQVTAGMRAMLVYNLTRAGSMPPAEQFPAALTAPLPAAPQPQAQRKEQGGRSGAGRAKSKGQAKQQQQMSEKQRKEQEQEQRRRGVELSASLSQQLRGHPHAPPPVNDLQGLGERVCASVREWEVALRAQSAVPPAAAGAGPSGSGGSGAAAGGGAAVQRRVPPALVLRLEHRYSHSGLGFANLKGRDAAVAQVLQAAGSLDLYLCLVTKWVKYATDEDEDGPFGGTYLTLPYYEEEAGEDESGEDESDSEKIVDVEAYGIRTTPLLAASGGPRLNMQLMQPGLHELLLDGGTVFRPRGEVEEGPPDERDPFYTGNEGAGLDYQYHRALLVISPRASELQLARAGGPPALMGLAERYLWRLGQLAQLAQLQQAAAAQHPGSSAAAAAGVDDAAGGAAGTGSAVGTGGLLSPRGSRRAARSKTKTSAATAHAPGTAEAARAAAAPQPATQHASPATQQAAAGATSAGAAADLADALQMQAAAASTAQLQHNLQRALLQAALSLSDPGRGDDGGGEATKPERDAWFYDRLEEMYSRWRGAERRAKRAAAVAHVLSLATSPRVLAHLSPQDVEPAVVQALHTLGATIPQDRGLRGASLLVAAVAQAAGAAGDTPAVVQALTALVTGHHVSSWLGEAAELVERLAARPALRESVRAAVLEQVGSLEAMRDLAWERLAVLPRLLWLAGSDGCGAEGASGGGGGAAAAGGESSGSGQGDGDGDGDDDSDGDEEARGLEGEAGGARQRQGRLRCQRDAFAIAVLGHVHSDHVGGQLQLQQLLEQPALQAAARAGDAAALRLLEAREAELRRRAARGPPADSWCMPEAKLEGHPEIEAFLRGPDVRRTFHGLWDSLTQARAWVHAHFPYPGGEGAATGGRWHSRDRLPGYAAQAMAGGKAKGAHVTVTKLRELQELRLEGFCRDVAQLEQVAALLATGRAAAATAANAAADAVTAGPLERRQRRGGSGEETGGDKYQNADVRGDGSKGVKTERDCAEAPGPASLRAAVAGTAGTTRVEDAGASLTLVGDTIDGSASGMPGQQAQVTAAAAAGNKRITRSAMRVAAAAAQRDLGARQGKRARKT